MPLKNLLRKGKKYDVSSRNAYVVCVHLLNGTLIECTLTSDSTGQECLENIAQRIELHEFVYFGLRYFNKKLQFRWLELDKPLKKQLDKNAHSPLLYFGVMFYVPEADGIADPMTRYQYYMQLKSDVIDGKLPCTPEQAVLLAAYSVQGEFGDFEEGKHNVDFFKEYVLLPRTMSTDDHLLQEMNQEIVNTHRNLQGVIPQVAEHQYIIEAQQLDGYGLEYFSAKDDSSNEIHLGISVIGIFVKPLPETEKPTSYFKWADINKIVPNKKTLGIETSLSAKTVHFQLDDSDAVRYVNRICLLQREFYDFMNSIRPAQAEQSVLSDTSGLENPVLAGGNQQLSQSQLKLQSEHIEAERIQDEAQFQTEELERRQSTGGTVLSTSYSEAQISDSQQHRQSAVELHMQTDMPPQIQTENAIESQLNRNQQMQDSNLAEMYQYEQLDGGYIQPSAMDALDAGQQANIQQYMEAMSQMHTTGDTQSNGFIPGQVPATSYTTETAQVPQYRQAPDYQSVVRQLAMQPQPQQPNPPQQHIGTSEVYNHPESMAYSQPEISRTPPTYQQYLQHNQRNPLQYSRSVLETRPNPQNYARNANQYQHYQPTGYGKPVDRTNSLNIHPTYSMPEISLRGLLNQFSTSEIQLTEKLATQQVAYKPPPPYRGIGSSSTPDLASQAARLAVTSSPDLVTNKDLSNLNLLAQSQLDRSAENLMLNAQRLRLSQQIAANSQHKLDEQCASSEQLAAQYNVAAGTLYGPVPLQGQELLNTQLYSSSGNIGQQYVGAGPQQFSQQPFAGSDGISQQYIENPILGPQFAGSGNVGPQQFARSGNIAPQYTGSGNVGPQYTGSGNVGPQYTGSGNVGPQYTGSGNVGPQYTGSGNVGPQYTGSGNVGPLYSGSGNVGPQYIQYTNATAVDAQTYAAQYGLSNSMAVQQYENIAPPQYAGNVNMNVQHYGGSNTMIQQQFNGPGSSGNIGPQNQQLYSSSGNIAPPVSNPYADEVEAEDPNKEVFITGPPNQNPPPTYHPLLGQQYSQNVAPNQIFYTANGIDLLNTPRPHSDETARKQEHIYQNLPAQKSLEEQRLLEYGDENPYENLPSALEGMQLLQAVHGEVQQTTADPDVMQCLDTTKDVESGSNPNHSQSSSVDTPNTVLQNPQTVSDNAEKLQTIADQSNNINAENVQLVQDQSQVNPEHSQALQDKLKVNEMHLNESEGHSKPVQDNLQLGKEHSHAMQDHTVQDISQCKGATELDARDILLKETQLGNCPLPTPNVRSNNPIAIASISLPSSHTFHNTQRVRSISTGSQERTSIVSTGDTAAEVFAIRDRSVSTSSYERLLRSRNERHHHRNRKSSTGPKGQRESLEGARSESGNGSARGTELDVFIPRPSITSSQPSPTIHAASTSQVVDGPSHVKERSPTSSTSSTSPPKPLNESSLSVSRADMIELNDNELRAPKDERRKAFEKKLSDDQVYAEFEQVPKKKSKCDCTCATLEQNVMRNRFKDVLPYDDNRVKLTPTKHNQTGYINASHVKMTVGKKESWYIASQGPLENTIQDFWQMIWEQESLVVAMLTDLNEFGKQKCQRYWPEEKGPKKATKYGDFQVTLKFINDSGSYITRGLVLRHKKLKKERLVWHLQYTDWPDHGCPEDTYGFIAYLDEIESVRRHAVLEHSDDRETPVVVHCSAGVGRSGVVILAEVMKACLEHNQNVTVSTVLERMRQQRMHLVQTVSQYSFVYKTLITYLKSSRLI